MKFDLDELGSNAICIKPMLQQFSLVSSIQDNEVVGVTMRLNQVFGQEFGHPRGV